MNMLKQKSKSKVRDAQSACRDAPKPFICCKTCCFIQHTATSPETNVHRRVRTDKATGLFIHIVVVSFRSN